MRTLISLLISLALLSGSAYAGTAVPQSIFQEKPPALSSKKELKLQRKLLRLKKKIHKRSLRDDDKNAKLAKNALTLSIVGIILSIVAAILGYFTIFGLLIAFSSVLIYIFSLGFIEPDDEEPAWLGGVITGFIISGIASLTTNVIALVNGSTARARLKNKEKGVESKSFPKASAAIILSIIGLTLPLLAVIFGGL